MTPTEQDKELRAITVGYTISSVSLSYTHLYTGLLVKS